MSKQSKVRLSRAIGIEQSDPKGSTRYKEGKPLNKPIIHYHPLTIRA